MHPSTARAACYCCSCLFSYIFVLYYLICIFFALFFCQQLKVETNHMIIRMIFALVCTLRSKPATPVVGNRAVYASWFLARWKCSMMWTQNVFTCTSNWNRRLIKVWFCILLCWSMYTTHGNCFHIPFMWCVYMTWKLVRSFVYVCACVCGSTEVGCVQPSQSTSVHV